MSIVLRLAAIYNLIFGAFAILAPTLFFSLNGMDQPRYPELWQCLGMVIGVYGVGYWIASFDPLRHWPIIFVGLLGKIFGPIGFLYALVSGKWPLSAGAMILTNDLLWWIPFGAILYAALFEANKPPKGVKPSVSAAELKERSKEEQLLLVFLRHAGCTFCRETLKNLAEFLEKNPSAPNVVIIHLGEENSTTKAFFAKYELADRERISDPTASLYREFELERGSFKQLFGLSVFVRGFFAFLRGNGIGMRVGDPFQMHAAFLLRDGGILKRQLPSHAGEPLRFQQLSS